MAEQEQQSSQPRLTVAIPLYNGARWKDMVAQNIQRIPADARIILSDEISSDDTAQRLAQQFVGDKRIAVRMGKGQPGWREHCNALIKENASEFFSLLPQDDLVEPGYYEKLVAALDANPKAGLAFGSLVAIGKHGKHQQLASPPFPLGKSEPWIEAILLERYWNLGIAFRGVIRQKVLRPILPTRDDQFADVLWVFGMALTAFLLEVPEATYLKHYYAGNTHGHWKSSMGERQAQLVEQIRDVFGEQDLTRHVIGCMQQEHVCPNTTRDKFYSFAKRFIPEKLLRKR